jgi:hypothetical protein
MYAVTSLEQAPVYPLAAEWREVVEPNVLPNPCHVYTQAWAIPFVNVSTSMPVVVSSRKSDAEADQMIDSLKMMQRPAIVFGPLDEHNLIKKSAWVGASFVAVDDPAHYDQQEAIESVVALIDRFSIGR